MEQIKSKSPPQPYENVYRGGFGPHAPSKDLPFPVNANITAYELLAFLPHSMQSADVIYRFISNGGTRHVLWVLINVARDLPKEWHANRCGTVMYKAMGDAGFENWTVKVHHKWHASRAADWDETILNVTGFRTASQMRSDKFEKDDIPFKSLARGVRRMPQDDDALDLTRMVQYCVQHPDEEWMYPRDYEKLCEVLGGAAPIRIGHIDRSAFKRWRETTPPPSRSWSGEEKKAASKATEIKPKRRWANSGRLGTPILKRRSREVTPATEGQRRMARGQKKGVTLERIHMEEEDKIPVAEDNAPQLEPYTRAPAEYVAPLEFARAPALVAVSLAFAAEHDVGAIDAFDAYAFGGPRYHPPYRMLHDIQPPNSADVSGWAENLRWAWEQRACFWHAVQTEGWNESPAHMELVARTRMKQVWASDELLEQLAEDHDDCTDPELEELAGG